MMLMNELIICISTSAILITNVKNLLSIPSTPITSGITGNTLDSNNYSVSVSDYNSSGLTPTVPATGLAFTFTRSNTKIAGVGSLTLTYSPNFLTVTTTMKIIMPDQQLLLTTVTSCQI